MKRSSRPRRTVELSKSLHQRLNMYALAAGAAGVSAIALAGCGKRLVSRNISRLLFLLSSDLGFRVVVKGRLRRFRDVIRHTEAAGDCA